MPIAAVGQYVYIYGTHAHSSPWTSIARCGERDESLRCAYIIPANNNKQKKNERKMSRHYFSDITGTVAATFK